MTLQDQIVEAQDYVSDPPQNESNTCDWIILPILRSLGYAPRDIESRIADSVGTYPDYTILSNQPASTFYLEAKAWNVALMDNHVKQSLNYANHNGKRFVVLTNGQDWQLYDNVVQGQLVQKRVDQAKLQDTSSIIDFLTALSKTLVLEGSLERTAAEAQERRVQDARNQQARQQQEEEKRAVQILQSEMRHLLDANLSDLLSNPQDELVFSIAGSLSSREGFAGISPNILASWFSENLSRLPIEEVKQPTRPTQGEVTLTLKKLQGKAINGKGGRPLTLQLPEGNIIHIRSWVNLAENIVRWLLVQPSLMPIPFEHSHPTRWFLNRSPEHKRPDLRKKFKEISSQQETVYMDADRSAADLISDLYTLCVRMQIDPDGFQITALL